jgi:autotransporter-associated beta strand protein
MNLRFDATQIISVTNSGETLTISGGITGAGGVTKEGLGELVFSGGNKYGGVTKVNVGSLNVQNATGLGTIAAGTEVVGEAALEIQGNIDIDREALTLRGYGQSSSGALRNISGTNSFAGAVTIAGTTEIASDSGTLTMKGGVSGTFNLNLDGAENRSLSLIQRRWRSVQSKK